MPPSFLKFEIQSTKMSLSIVNPANTPSSSLQELSNRLQAKSANFPRFFFQNTILPFILGNFFLTFMSVFRDKVIEISCFTDQEVCKCSFVQIAFYAFLNFPLTELVPYSLVHILLFSCKKSFIPVGFKRGLSALMIVFITPMTYLTCGLFYPWISARLVNYSLCLFVVYLSIYCFVLFNGKNFRYFFKEVSCGTLCLLIPFFYYILTDFLLPNFYFVLTRLFQDDAKNVFQVLMIFINFLYEMIFFQMLLRVSHYFLQQGIKSNTYLILLVRFYLGTLYALRLGNIISLKITDWGLYVQIFSLIILVFETSTGRSFPKYFVSKPIQVIQLKIKDFLRIFYQIYLDMPAKNDLVAKKRIFLMGTHIPASKEDSSSLRISITTNSRSDRINPNFTNRKPLENQNSTMTQDLVKKAQKKLLEVISYQKFEFLLIYVPAILSLALTKSWRTPDPEMKITESCGFNIVNMIIYYDSLFLYIFIDFALTFLFFKIFECYKNMRLKYEMGKMNLMVQILLYMGYQLMLETWIGRIAALRLV